MKISMTRADLVVALSALQSFAAGFEETTSSSVFDEILDAKIEDILEKKIVNDGIGVITYTEEGIEVEVSPEGLAKVYEAYDMGALGRLAGSVAMTLKMAKAYKKATDKRLNKLAEDNPAVKVKR